jgi:hypothetical protein
MEQPQDVDALLSHPAIQYPETRQGRRYSPEYIRAMRKLYKDGKTCRQIATAAGCSPQLVYAIVSGRSYRDVE